MRRGPFDVRELDEVVAFCLANGSPFDGALLRTLFLELTSDPCGVLVVRGAEGLRLVGAVVDRPDNAADAATLEIIGVGEAVTADAFSVLMLEPAVAFALAGPRRALHVAAYPACARIQGMTGVLRAAGFVPCYESFTMRRPDDVQVGAAVGPLSPGWRWETLGLERADPAHAVLAEAFEGAMGTALPPLPVFRRAVGSGAATWRVLLDGETIAGLTRVISHETHGEIRILARAPRYRGRGLGPHLLAEALRLLLAGAGPRPVELAVEAENERALALYRRFGFEVASRTPVFSLELGLRRGPSGATS